MEGRTIIKLFVFLAVVAGAVYYFNTLKQERQAKIDEIAVEIGQAAQVIAESGGTEPERVVTALAFIETTEWDFLEDAVLQTGDGVANFAAAELVLRRIYEMPYTTMIPSVLVVTGADGSLPWVLDGETPRMVEFELRGFLSGDMEDLLKAFSQQGKRRAQWR